MQLKYLYIRDVQLLGAWAIKFSVLTLNIFTIIVCIRSDGKVKLSRNRPSWPKGFRVG
jgi:hypothetical protein